MRISALTFALVLLGCSAATEDSMPYDGPPLDDSGFDTAQKADANGIEWIRSAEPQVIEFDERVVGNVSYRHCEASSSGDRSEDGTININISVSCGTPTADIAWYVIPAEAVQAFVDGGYATVSLTVGVTGPSEYARVRTSIHRTDAGERELSARTRLSSYSMLFDGDSLSTDLDSAGDYHFLVARGASIYPFWGTGEIDFTLQVAASFEGATEPPPLPTEDPAPGTW